MVCGIVLPGIGQCRIQRPWVEVRAGLEASSETGCPESGLVREEILSSAPFGLADLGHLASFIMNGPLCNRPQIRNDSHLAPNGFPPLAI